MKQQTDGYRPAARDREYTFDLDCNDRKLCRGNECKCGDGAAVTVQASGVDTIRMPNQQSDRLHMAPN